MTRLPLYFNCHFFKSLGVETIYKYKIDASSVHAHPYQLFRREIDAWQNLSVYASINDAVMILLKELFSSELADKVYHGQAIVNPAEILDKIKHGERLISISGSDNEVFKMEFEVNFDDLIERTGSHKIVYD